MRSRDNADLETLAKRCSMVHTRDCNICSSSNNVEKVVDSCGIFFLHAANILFSKRILGVSMRLCVKNKTVYLKQVSVKWLAATKLP